MDGSRRAPWRTAMMAVRQQFANPTGWMGALIGHLMAVKNRERSEWVLTQLGIGPADHVLEVGFGSGVDVQRPARPARGVGGIDQSAVMLRRAGRRTRRAFAEGRVARRLGAVPPL